MERYSCTKLGGIAVIEIEEHFCGHEDPNDTHLEYIQFNSCANWFDCGIYRRRSDGGFSMVENIRTACPKHIEIDELNAAINEQVS